MLENQLCFIYRNKLCLKWGINIDSRSQTSEELAKLLGLKPENNQAYLNNYRRILDSQAKLSKGTTVQIANKLFAAQDLTIKPTFKKALETIYNSDIQNVDFKNSKETVDIINNFVSDKTKGLINKVLNEDEIDGFARYHILRELYTKKL